MTDEQLAELAERLSAKHVESQYILSDSRGIAYQMVAPEVVLEISVLELVARGNDDKVKTNPLLAYDEAKGWMMQGMVTVCQNAHFGFTLEGASEWLRCKALRMRAQGVY